MTKSLESKIYTFIFIFITLPFLILGIVVIFTLVNNMMRLPLVLMYSFAQFVGYFIFRRTIKKHVLILYNSEKICSDIDQYDLNNLDTSIERYYKLFKAFKFSEQVERQINDDIQSLVSELVKLKGKMDKSLNLQTETKDELEFDKSSNEIFMNSITQPMILFNNEGLVLFANQEFIKQYKYSKVETNNINSIFKYNKEEVRALELLKSSLDSYVSLNPENNAMFKTIQVSSDQYLTIGKSLEDEVAFHSKILRKNREIEYINQINSSLISNWDIDELLDNIMKRMDSLFNLSFGCIHIINDQGNWELKICKTHKITSTQVKDLSIPKYFTEDWVRSISIKTIDARISHISDLSYIVIAPLEVNGKIIAAMSIGLNRELSNNDENLLKMFNHQASMVVQRAILYEQLRKQYLNTIEALVNVIEAKDKYTEGHSRRVSRFAVEIAKKMGYSNEEIENVEISGLLHDVGKIGIHQDILVKEGKLTDQEYEQMKEHPLKGIQVLEAIKLNQNIQEGILYHHLRYDLKGYPKTNIEALPVFASIIGAADAFDAITSARSYSKAQSIEEAISELERYKGSQFAPEMVDIFSRLIVENYDRILNIIEDVSEN